MSVKDEHGPVNALDRASAALRDAERELERAREEVRESAEGSGAETVGEFARRLQVGEEALVAFAEAAREALGGGALSPSAARRAGLLAVAEQAWDDELGPLLSGAQVRELLGDVSRQRIDELLRARRLIGLRDSRGRRRFPVFQFQDSQPLAPLVAAFWIVADAVSSDWTAASWCVSWDAALDGTSPVRWARAGADPARLAQVARQDAARLAR